MSIIHASSAQLRCLKPAESAAGWALLPCSLRSLTFPPCCARKACTSAAPLKSTYFLSAMLTSEQCPKLNTEGLEERSVAKSDQGMLIFLIVESASTCATCKNTKIEWRNHHASSYLHRRIDSIIKTFMAETMRPHAPTFDAPRPIRRTDSTKQTRRHRRPPWLAQLP